PVVLPELGEGVEVADRILAHLGERVGLSQHELGAGIVDLGAAGGGVGDGLLDGGDVRDRLEEAGPTGARRPGAPRHAVDQIDVALVAELDLVAVRHDFFSKSTVVSSSSASAMARRLTP